MPPSSSPSPVERLYRDVQYVGMEESDGGMDSFESLIKKLEVDSKTEVSVDDLTHSIKEWFKLEAHDSKIRDLAQFIMRLKLKDPADADASNQKDASAPSIPRDHVASRRGSNPSKESGRSSSRNRGTSPRGSNPFPGVNQRSYSKHYDPTGLLPPTPNEDSPFPYLLVMRLLIRWIARLNLFPPWQTHLDLVWVLLTRLRQ